MNEDLKKIKKHYGEKMMHFCRVSFPTLLEKKGYLPELLINKFNSDSSLYDDIDVYGKMGEFKNYVYQMVDEEKETQKNILNRVDTPEKLLSDVNYDLYMCKTESDIQSFKKYYAKSEELCTFKGGRLHKCHVFFAIKKNIDEIKRENFENPSRQDEYGTSIISIQFTKDDSCTLSIKNRYNHSVSNPDATFSNNLNNIVNGLSDSFARHYGMKQKYINKFELPSYVKANDGKYYRYNCEINNKYYCPNNIIIDDFEVKHLAKEKYILMDYFVLDLQKKELKVYDESINDSFADIALNICNIEIKKINNTKEIIIFTEKGNTEITLDRDGKIIGFVNNDVINIGDYFLRHNGFLKSLEMHNLEQVGRGFLIKNKYLENMKLPNLKRTGEGFLCFNILLNNLELPNLKQTGDYFLTSNIHLTHAHMPNLKQIGTNFLTSNINLKKIELPNLKEIGSHFLNSNAELRESILSNVSGKKR